MKLVSYLGLEENSESQTPGLESPGGDRTMKRRTTVRKKFPEILLVIQSLASLLLVDSIRKPDFKEA